MFKINSLKQAMKEINNSTGFTRINKFRQLGTQYVILFKKTPDKDILLGGMHGVRLSYDIFNTTFCTGKTEKEVEYLKSLKSLSDQIYEAMYRDYVDTVNRSAEEKALKANRQYIPIDWQDTEAHTYAAYYSKDVNERDKNVSRPISAPTTIYVTECIVVPLDASQIPLIDKATVCEFNLSNSKVKELCDVLDNPVFNWDDEWLQVSNSFTGVNIQLASQQALVGVDERAARINPKEPAWKEVLDKLSSQMSQDVETMMSKNSTSRYSLPCSELGDTIIKSFQTPTEFTRKFIRYIDTNSLTGFSLNEVPEELTIKDVANVVNNTPEVQTVKTVTEAAKVPGYTDVDDMEIEDVNI